MRCHGQLALRLRGLGPARNSPVFSYLPAMRKTAFQPCLSAGVAKK
jgi:hypothetical protein